MTFLFSNAIMKTPNSLDTILEEIYEHFTVIQQNWMLDMNTKFVSSHFSLTFVKESIVFTAHICSSLFAVDSNITQVIYLQTQVNTLLSTLQAIQNSLCILLWRTYTYFQYNI